ncbi:hypothetical protein A3Q56_05846 [Intoshia linei]|uniref:Uncharacterized protein n=1 Tax=Intoshia linei TaxID=1819745 RepID=A0A177AWN7_9BILA|nr:hypothetical protein A3Q56_05846 [Intoshia linei]
MSENEKDNSTFRNYSKFKLIRFPLLSTPDGQDSLYKVFRTTLSTTTIGAVFTYLDLISTINLTTLNWKIIKGRFKKITIPAAFLGYVYSSTANVSGSIRGRNDSINHSNAGIASGIALAYLSNKLTLICNNGS